MSILSLRELAAGYAPQRPVLSGVSLEVRAGQVVALLGANGTGKTTLLRTVAGLARPLAGAVLLGGSLLPEGAARRAASGIALSFQNPDDQLFGATVAEDVAVGPRQAGLSPAEVRAEVEGALCAAGIEALADRPIDALSFGEKRRACLAGVLAMRPKVLLLDEPTAGLDPAGEIQAARLIAEVARARGTAILVATHAVDLVPLFADTVALLGGGRLLLCAAGRGLRGARAARARPAACAAPGGDLAGGPRPAARPAHRCRRCRAPLAPPRARRRMTGLLFVAHGSRDPVAIAEIEAFVAAYRARSSALPCALAYVELARPTLQEAIAQLAARVDTVVAVPLFLFAARHVKNDLPLALEAARRAFPSVRFAVAQPFGVHPALVELAFARALASPLPPTPEAAARTAMVALGRGSSDPDANGDFCKLARLLGEGRGLLHVEPAFVGVARPTLEEALELLARLRPERVLVVPYLLFSGLLLQRVRERVEAFGRRQPWIRVAVAPHLSDGPLDALLDHVDRRAQEALEGAAPLPCDTCQYRVPLAGLQEQVGGMKALLWSIRHSHTHSQAAPHRHAHKPLVKHVLVCGNADCADRGSVGVLEALRRRLAALGKQKLFRITRTSCMGRCGEGPTVAVYPDGVWYRGVRAEDADELVDEHLLRDRLVARLVDQILQ